MGILVNPVTTRAVMVGAGILASAIGQAYGLPSSAHRSPV